MTKPRPSKEIAPDLIDRLRSRFGGWPLIRDWGLVIEHVETGVARLTMLPTAFTVNATTGIVNGGVLATLADVACALALCTEYDGRMPFATADLHIRYLEPAQGELTIEASVVRASLRGAVLDCCIRCGDNKVAVATAQFIITNPPKGTP